MMLHASRDAMRNRGEDTLKWRFVATDGQYGEAFGIMRCLAVLGYGYYGSSNLHALREDSRDHKVNNVTQEIQNLKWWFCQIEQSVIEAEGFNGDHRCEHCLDRYKKDDAVLIEKGLLSSVA